MSTKLQRESLKKYEKNILHISRAIKNLKNIYLVSENFVEMSMLKTELEVYLKEEQNAFEEAKKIYNE